MSLRMAVAAAPMGPSPRSGFEGSNEYLNCRTACAGTSSTPVVVVSRHPRITLRVRSSKIGSAAPLGSAQICSGTSLTRAGPPLPSRYHRHSPVVSR